jgi:hypothetical protein
MSYKHEQEIEKLKKHYNPVDWFNKFGDFVAIFDNSKGYRVKSSTEAICDTTGDIITYNNGIVLMGDERLTLFQLLTIVQFKSVHWDAQFFVEYKLLKKQIPFIRVGSDYYRVNVKVSRYGVTQKKLKAWKKETIIDDHGKELLKEIPKFYDFTILPDNRNYQEWSDNYYNLYSPFPHKVADHDGQFKHIKLLLEHIFGEQVELAYKYLKVMYEHPTQILPILVMVSTERQTGKTTFLNLLDIIFGDNFVLIKPEDLQNQFNHIYATKNIIGIDETVIEKTSIVEKLKAIATQKTMTVNQKHVSQYSIPFFGKIVMATNKEDEFMKIDEEEIRFWVRKVGTIENLITDIEQHMRDEVPYFLRYLEQLPEVDRTKSRMVFTADEIWTDKLNEVMAESKTWLYKELEMLFQSIFYECTADEVMFTAKELKEAEYRTNNNAPQNFIHKTLKKDFKLDVPDGIIRYHSYFSESPYETKPGRPFILKRKDWIDDKDVNEISKFVNENVNDEDVPF